MPLFGIDVSRHQGPDIAWDQIRASGIAFMLARASLATTPDPTYGGNVRRRVWRGSRSSAPTTSSIRRASSLPSTRPGCSSLGSGMPTGS
jgi:hypothetical protein